MGMSYYPKSVIGIEITLDELETNLSFEWKKSLCYSEEEGHFEFDTFKDYFESKNEFYQIKEVNDAYYDEEPSFLIGLRTSLFLENPKLLPKMLKKLRAFLDKKGFEKKQIDLVANIYAC